MLRLHNFHHADIGARPYSFRFRFPGLSETQTQVAARPRYTSWKNHVRSAFYFRRLRCLAECEGNTRRGGVMKKWVAVVGVAATAITDKKI